MSTEIVKTGDRPAGRTDERSDLVRIAHAAISAIGSIALAVFAGIGFLLFLMFPAGPPRYYDPLVHGGFDPPVLHSYFGRDGRDEAEELLERQSGNRDKPRIVDTRPPHRPQPPGAAAPAPAGYPQVND